VLHDLVQRHARRLDPRQALDPKLEVHQVFR
jgi:hypothetical protein